MVNVEISEFVKKKLEAIKREEEHKSLDGVVRSLLERQEKMEEKKIEKER